MRFILFIGYIKYTLINVLILIFITFILSAGLCAIPGLEKMLFDKVFITLDVYLLFKYIGIQIFIIIYLAMFAIIYSLYENNLYNKLTNKIKVNYLKKLLRSKDAFIKMHDTGYLVKRLIEDSNAIADGLAKTISILCNFIMIITIASILYYIEYWLFALYLGLVISSFIWMLLWVYPIHRFNMKIGNEYSILYKTLWEVLQGIKEIKLQNLNEIIRKKINKNNNGIKSALFFNALFNTCMWQYANVFYTLGYIAILVHGLQRIQAGELSIGMLLGLLTMVSYLLDPIQKIYNSIGIVQSGIAAAIRINVIKAAPKEKSGKKKFTALDSSIDFKNITFSYDGKEKVLNNVNIHIPKKSKIAFVGKTGSGKTTIIQLLIKLYDNYSGSITIDHIPLEMYNTDSIRSKIVFISQDVQLYKDSIRNNIDFTQSLSDAEMSEIIRKVNLEGLVSRLENGIDTVIGEDGINFSGGERQRIAIARCMAVNPEIVILDEITASLDPKNEDSIIKTLIEHFKDKTVVSISHRQSTILNCDLIYVFKNGEIIEQGKYSDLIGMKGEYCTNFQN